MCLEQPFCSCVSWEPRSQASPHPLAPHRPLRQFPRSPGGPGLCSGRAAGGRGADPRSSRSLRGVGWPCRPAAVGADEGGGDALRAWALCSPAPPQPSRTPSQGLSQRQACRKKAEPAPSTSQRQRPGGAGGFAAPAGRDPCSRTTVSDTPSAEGHGQPPGAAASPPSAGPLRVRVRVRVRARHQLLHICLYTVGLLHESRPNYLNICRAKLKLLYQSCIFSFPIFGVISHPCVSLFL